MNADAACARITHLKTRPKAQRMSECVFCQIASGEVRSEIIYEDDQVIGLMDICPIRPGHVQIIPREHDSASRHMRPRRAA